MALNLWCPQCGERNPERNVSQPCRKCGAKLPTKDGAVWYVNLHDTDGYHIRRRAGSYLDARDMENAIHRARREGKLWRAENSKATLGDLQDAYLQEPTIQAMKDYRTRSKAIGRIVADLGRERIVMGLSPQVIAEYQQGREREGITGSSINRETGYLSVMLDWFAAVGKVIPRNPIAEAPRLDENPARNRTMTDQEGEAIARALPDHWRPVFEVLRWLPLRLAEALALDWTTQTGRPFIDQLPDPQRPWLWAIIVPAGVSKSGRERAVPVYYAGLRDTLKALPSRSTVPRGPVFVDPMGRKLTEYDIRRPWGEARKAAGCEDLRIHDLKHTAVTTLLHYHVPPHDVAFASDHASARIQQLYANMTKERILRSRDRWFNPATGLIEAVESATPASALTHKA